MISISKLIASFKKKKVGISMTYYNLNTIRNYIQTSNKIKAVKVTSVTELDWNAMEGQIYQVNVKVTTIDGFKNRFLKTVVNDTYLEDFETIDKAGFETYFCN